MSDKPGACGKPSPHGWTLDTLERYLSEKIAANHHYVVDLAAERGRALDQALKLAQDSAEKRAQASNEIRAAMIDQQAQFADKISVDLRFGGVERRLGVAENLLASSAGKSQGVGLLAAILAAVVTAIAAVAGTVGVFMAVLQ